MDELVARTHYTQIFIDRIVNMTVLSRKMQSPLALVRDGKMETAWPTLPSPSHACGMRIGRRTPALARAARLAVLAAATPLPQLSPVTGSAERTGAFACRPLAAGFFQRERPTSTPVHVGRQ
jgi:hypothetical protein